MTMRLPTARDTETQSDAPDWLLLVYSLPATPAQARVQTWRRLQRVGAVPVKNTAYVLPASPDAREDFEWVKNEIVGAGGQALVLIARAPDADGSDQIVDAFRQARAPDYVEVVREGTALLKRTKAPAGAGRRQLMQAVRRLRERYEHLLRIDFFAAPGRDDAAAVLDALEQSARRDVVKRTPAQSGTVDTARFKKKLWVTRPRPGVDRMSSAWLIRRFIDPDARFQFGDPAKIAGAVPFDTYNAEFGHHDGRCTFETLCERFGIADRAAHWIGRIVHDIDLKTDDYGETETATVARVIEGLRKAQPDDHALLAQGVATFEALYQTWTDRKSGRPPARPHKAGRRKKA